MKMLVVIGEEEAMMMMMIAGEEDTLDERAEEMMILMMKVVIGIGEAVAEEADLPAATGEMTIMMTTKEGDKVGLVVEPVKEEGAETMGEVRVMDEVMMTMIITIKVESKDNPVDDRRVNKPEETKITMTTAIRDSGETVQEVDLSAVRGEKMEMIITEEQIGMTIEEEEKEVEEESVMTTQWHRRVRDMP